MVRWVVTLPWRLLHLAISLQWILARGYPAMVLSVDHAWQKSKNHIKTSPPIKYLTIDPTKIWCMGKRCGTTRRITSRSPICDATNIHRSAVENVRRIDVFRTFCDATRPKIIATQFGDREVNLRLILHISRIHHFLVRRIFKFLIAYEVPALRRRKKPANIQKCRRNYSTYDTKNDVYKKVA